MSATVATCGSEKIQVYCARFATVLIVDKVVRSGADLRCKPDLQKPLDYALVGLLFTKGEGKVNENGSAPGLRCGRKLPLQQIILNQILQESDCDRHQIYAHARQDVGDRKGFTISGSPQWRNWH